MTTTKTQHTQGELKAPRLELQSTIFRFTIKGGVEWSATWFENGEESKRKYRVEICRGGGLRGQWYTDQFINKSNSKELIIATMKEENGTSTI